MRQQNADSPSKDATEWFVQLSSGQATEEDYQAWQAWRAAQPENELAWQKVEQVTDRLKSISGQAGVVGVLHRLYDKPSSAGRRRVLKQLVILVAAGSSGYFTYKQQPWQGLMADYTTATGEHRKVVLADGTHLFLNTATIVNVDFNGRERILTLLKGEVLIETGHEQNAASRPFILKTQHGEVTALGTRFNVRDQHDFSSVDLFEGGVRVVPKHNQTAETVLQAGESVKFSAAMIQSKSVADPAASAWTTGFLIVDNMTLTHFAAELARYRTGLIQCDPRVGQLLISGSFPVDTEASLDILMRKLPVKIQTYTRYWIKIIPA